MIIKKAQVKKKIVTVLIFLFLLTAFTGIFKLYHDSKYVKGEYSRICPQNYGDPVSLERCYWPYEFEGKTLENALKVEVAAILVVPLLIFLASLI